MVFILFFPLFSHSLPSPRAYGFWGILHLSKKNFNIRCYPCWKSGGGKLFVLFWLYKASTTYFILKRFGVHWGTMRSQHNNKYSELQQHQHFCYCCNIDIWMLILELAIIHQHQWLPSIREGLPEELCFSKGLESCRNQLSHRRKAPTKNGCPISAHFLALILAGVNLQQPFFSSWG